MDIGELGRMEMNYLLIMIDTSRCQLNDSDCISLFKCGELFSFKWRYEWFTVWVLGDPESWGLKRNPVKVIFYIFNTQEIYYFNREIFSLSSLN